MDELQNKFPLSYSQERMWFMDHLEPNKPLYSFTQGFTIIGEINYQDFEDSIKLIINRHEVLRTSFYYTKSELIQQIHPDLDFKVTIESVKNLPDREKKQKVKDLIKNESKIFNLKKPPLFRVKLIEQNEQEHLMLLSTHHIIFDGWSMNLFLDELTNIYENRLLKVKNSLPLLPLQYLDYALWQRENYEEGNMDSKLNYWKNHLEGGQFVSELHTDFPRPTNNNYVGKIERFDIKLDLLNKLSQFSNHKGITNFMTLLAVFKILLYKYSNQEDILVGSPIANRKISETENLIGFFANTILLRTNLSSDQTISELLIQIRKNTIAAFENQEIPFEKIVEELQPEREYGVNPLFQHMFVYQNNKITKRAENNRELKINPYFINNETSKFDITFEVVESKSGMDCAISYNVELYKESTILNMIEHFKNIFESILKNSEQKISEIVLLTNKEIKFEDNKTTILKGIVEKFEEQVKRVPNNIACEMDRKKLTYKELHKEVNMVAKHLREKGITKSNIVAVNMERSIEMLICILAIWKVRAIYLPIDPSLPKQRILNMLNDSQPKLLIVDTEEVVDYECDLLNIKRLKENKNTLNEEFKENHHLSDSAYIIYTSGSTGNPKGAIVEHIGMSNHIEAKVKDLNMNSSTKVAQNASHSFDISIWQFLSALTVGGTTVIYSKEDIRDLKKFLNLLINDGIDILQVVPSYLSVILDYLEANQNNPELVLNNLKCLIATGEALTASLVKKWFKYFPDIKMLNAYGPTEASDDITHYFITSDIFSETSNIPIGKPLQNFSLYIVDKDLNICPEGVRGEICVAGIGVGPGYLNNFKRTRESFIQNPFVENEKNRFYKTGDFGKKLSDGNFVFLGRIDEQVKVRGFRIELSEIEFALSNIPNIKDAVVITQKDSRNEDIINAYVTGTSPISYVSTIKDLSEILPDYMWPTNIVQLEELPLNQNGKIDKALLRQLKTNEKSNLDYIAPRTELELHISKIWSEILNINKISVYDNFFKIGGHSLKAINLIIKIRKELKINLPMQEIFKNPTVSKLSEYIDKFSPTGYEVIPKVEKRNFYPSSSAQKRVYTLQQMSKSTTSYNMPKFIKIKGELDTERMEEAIQHLCQRHEILRTTFVISDDGEPFQKINELANYIFVIQKNLKANLKEVISNFITPFDLEKGPLFRVKYLRISSDESYLMLDMHHIISDGVSLNIILEELFKLYYLEILPEIELQYRDYSSWEKNFLLSNQYMDKEKYWINVFKSPLPKLNLPLDYERPNIKGFDGGIYHFELNKGMTKEVLRLSSETDTTLYMTLLAIYNILLHKYSGHEDIIVGSPVSGRMHSEIEETVGLFVNTIALRNFPEKNKSFKEFLNEVKIHALEAYNHQDYSFDRLINKINIKQDLSRNSLFDTMFTLQNIDKLNLGEINSEIESIDLRSVFPDLSIGSKFDLSLGGIEKNDQIFFTIDYSKAVFKKDTIAKIAEHYIKLIEFITSQPGVTIENINIESSNKEVEFINEDFNFDF